MIDTFEAEKQANIQKLGESDDLHALSMQWVAEVSRHKYSYHFSWLGRPVIQFPQDLIAMQEIIWRVQPSLIIETGVARGGSLIFYASLLELSGGDGRVIGIDIDIREHTVEFVVAVKNVGNQSISLDRSVGLRFQLNLHVFLSSQRRRERYMNSSASRLVKHSLAKFCPWICVVADGIHAPDLGGYGSSRHSCRLGNRDCWALLAFRGTRA